MSNLKLYKETVVHDADLNPCSKCVLKESWDASLSCKAVKARRFDLKGSIAAEDDKVELLIVGDPPTRADENNGAYFSDKYARAILRLVADTNPKSFVLLPSVRCFPGEEVDHFVLKKKYRNERGQTRETGTDVATEAVKHCAEYFKRAKAVFRPQRTLAIGAFATKATLNDQNVFKLRSVPIHQDKGTLKAVSGATGTVATWDRAYIKVDEWAADDVVNDIEKLANLRDFGFATRRGDHKTVTQTVLDTVEKVNNFVDWALSSEIPKTDLLCFDYETDNLSFKTEENRILTVGFSFTSRENEAWVVPFAHPETPFSPTELEQVKAALVRLFEAEGASFRGIVAHNAQFEVGITKSQLGLWLGDKGKKVTFDLMILAYLENENRWKRGTNKPYALETLAREYIGFQWYADTGIKSRRDKLAEEPIDSVNEYVGFDAVVTSRLWNHLIESIEAEGSKEDIVGVMEHIYSEAIHYTVDMQITGQPIDWELLMFLRGKDSPIGPRVREIQNIFNESPEAKAAIKIVKKNKAKARGNKGQPLFSTSSIKDEDDKFDLNSDVYRKALFWDVMRLPGANSSVDKKFQEEHRDVPLVALFQEYQAMSTLEGLFLEPIAKYLQESSDGRLHPSFNLSKTTSGRLSASEPNCYDGDTEILTRRGWVPFPELKNEDEVAQWEPKSDIVDFVVPHDIVRMPYNGDMIWIQNDHIDLMVTPNHRCPLVSPTNGKVTVFRADEYRGGASKWKQMQASYYRGGNVSLSEEEIALICAAQADGSFRPDVKRGAMEWTLVKQRKVGRLRDVLTATGSIYTDNNKPRKGRTAGRRFYLSRCASLDLIESALDADKAFRMEWLLSLDRDTLDRFVAEVNFWDGCFTRNNQYTSTNKKNVDVVQAALLLSRVRATVNKRDKSNAWTIHQTNARSYSWTTNLQPQRVGSPHDQMVYCVSVPTGFVVVRRNGKPALCGQTQQVPRGDTKDKKLIKSLYSSSPGMLMVQTDFSQAEVRWLGILSGDANLAKRYKKAKRLKAKLRADPTNKELQTLVKIDGDLHMSTAIGMYKLDRIKVVDPETGELTPFAKPQRQKAKSVCFGLIYGKTVKSLAEDLGISEEETQEAVDLWMSQSPEAAAWLNAVDREIANTCVARSPFGRWRRLPEAKAATRSVQNRARRQARNTPIQSAASDFCIYAACKLRRALQNHPNPALRKARLINTVHDSLAAEVPADPMVVLEYMKLAESIFTDKDLVKEDFGIEINVPLEIDFDIGLNWGNVQGVSIDIDEVTAAVHDAEVLRAQPVGTILKDLKGKGLLYAERQLSS